MSIIPQKWTRLEDARFFLSDVFNNRTPEQIMSSQSQSEEQKQAIALLHRYRRFRERKELPYIIAFFVLFFTVLVQTVRLQRFHVFAVFSIAALFSVFFCIGLALQRRLSDFFVRRMTPEEYELLVNVSKKGLDETEKPYASELIKAYKEINPEKEYLRPSQRSGEETLLRAAMQSHDIPQEELLRASHSSERQQSHEETGNLKMG